MKKYRLSRIAASDLDDIWLYIARDAPEAADRFVDSIEKKLHILAAGPDAGRVCEGLTPGIHRFPVGAYGIFYRIHEANIEIIRILHGARDTKSIFKSRE